MNHLRFYIAVFALIFVNSRCAVLGNGEESESKSSSMKYSNPPSPYEKVNISSADLVWQSKSTGNTIAVNSTCNKYSDVSLKNLQENILAGVENLTVTRNENVNFDGRSANRVTAAGETDGVPIQLDLLILKKNNCSYDVAYIARQKSFDREHKIFEAFLREFRVP